MEAGYKCALTKGVILKFGEPVFQCGEVRSLSTGAVWKCGG